MHLRPRLTDYMRGYAALQRHGSRSMIKPRRYIENIALCSMRLRDPALARGAIIECGTWRGGMSAGLIDVCGPNRTYHFFDSFEGLPPVTALDGPRAKAWQADKDDPSYVNNCAASIDEFKETISRTRYNPANLYIHKGFFADSFQTVTPPSIAILRLDADWYESTMECLEKFWDHVLPRGLVIIDDYYDWEGCTRAVHDFLSRRGAVERVLQGPYAGVCAIFRYPPQPT